MANLASNQSWWNSEMANELRSLFYNQYYKNTSALDFLNGKMRAMVNNPTGYSPAALAAMRTGATENASNEFSHAQQALNAQEMAHGGEDLPSGVNAQLNAGLYAQEAAQKANAENQITLANEDQRQNNYWRGVQGLDTVAEQRNPNALLGESLNASAGVGGLVNAATNVNNSGFGHMLEGSIAQGLGSELTGGNSTGSGTAAGFFGF